MTAEECLPKIGDCPGATPTQEQHPGRYHELDPYQCIPCPVSSTRPPGQWRNAVVPSHHAARLTAAEIMSRNVITFPPEAPLTRVLQTLVDFRVKSFPVVAGGQILGMIVREDVVRALRDASGDQSPGRLPASKAED